MRIKWDAIQSLADGWLSMTTRTTVFIAIAIVEWLHSGVPSARTSLHGPHQVDWPAPPPAVWIHGLRWYSGASLGSCKLVSFSVKPTVTHFNIDPLSQEEGMYFYFLQQTYFNRYFNKEHQLSFLRTFLLFLE